MKVVLIAAMAANRTIGINNTLPWKLSADLKRFKALTTGHTILMGRKTFESLGRPLPGRKHICVSRSYSKQEFSPDPRWPDQVFWCGDLKSALEVIKKNESPENAVCYIIGGAEIYAQALPLADTLEITQIHANFDGDAWFPYFENLFEKKEESSSEESGLKFSFVRFESKRPHAVIVRKCTLEDAEFISAAQIKMAWESEGLKLDPLKVESGVKAALIDRNKGEYLIAEYTDNSQSNPVGCLLLQKEWSDWRNGFFLWVHSLYVEPSYRNQGICRWMLKVTQAQAKSQADLGVRLYVDKRNLKAQAVYKKCGMSDGHYDLFETEF